MAIVFRKTPNPSTLVDLNQLLPVLRDPGRRVRPDSIRYRAHRVVVVIETIAVWPPGQAHRGWH